MSLISKIAMGAQVFLLSRNWAGPMGDFVMTITTTGRKTGKEYATPVAYIYDGPHFLALTSNPPRSNWFKNVIKSGEAVLNIKGKEIAVYGAEVTEPAERRRLFDLYRQSPENFKRIFGVEPDAEEKTLAEILEKWAFMHFSRIMP